LVHPKKSLSELKKIEIKYVFEALEERNNFLHRNLSRFESDCELKFGEAKVYF
jgi:hypothetical protein